MATKLDVDFKTTEAQEERRPLIVHCDDCRHEWTACYLPADLGLVAKSLKKLFCPVCLKKTRILMGPYPKPTDEGNAEAWLHNGDTGTSSLTIWSVMMGRDPWHGWGNADVPHDAADFGRCYRLLQVMPAWRPRLQEVAVAHPDWKRLVDEWDELTALYEEELPSGMCRKLYERMQQLRGEQ